MIRKAIKYFKRKRKSGCTVNSIPNINSAENYLFIHIPKNGGTSIYEALGMERSHHNTYVEYQCIIGEPEMENYFKFSFVRNPWERFVSLYDYARSPISYHHNSIDPKKGRYGKHADYELLKDASIEQCAEYLLEGVLVHGTNRPQWNNQCEWLKNRAGDIELSFIGRMENFNKDCKILGYYLKKDLLVKHLNASNKGDYKDRLTGRAISIIGKYYEEDIDLFKYTY